MSLQTLFNQIDKVKRDPALAHIAPQIIQTINQEEPQTQMPLIAPMNPVAVAVNDEAVQPNGLQSIAPRLTSTITDTGASVAAMPQIQPIQPQIQQNPAPTDSSPVASPLAGIVPQIPQSLQTAQEIKAILGKDYSKAIYKHPTTGEMSDRQKPGFVLEKAAGKDRVKNWSTGDKIRNGVIGALTGFAAGGVGGAAAGAALSASNRNYQNQKKDAAILGKLRPQLAEQQRFELNQANQRKADFDANNSQIEGQGKILTNAKTAGEITKLDVDTINSRIKPLLDTYSADKRIDAKEAETLTKLSGLPYNAAQWQTYIDKEINGNTLTRSEFDPRYTENKTVSTNPGGVYRDMKIGKGAPVPVKTDNIPGLAISTEDRNAAREQSAYEFKATQDRLDKQFSIDTALKIQQYNTDQFGKFQGDMRGWQTEQTKANATVQKNAPLLSAYDNQINEANAYLNGEKAKTDAVLNPTLITQAKTTLQNAQIEKQKAQGEIDAANYFIQNVPRPEQRPSIGLPRQNKTRSGRNTNRKNSYSASDIERVMKQ